MDDSNGEITYSFVAPVHNEAEGLEHFYQRLKAVAESLGDSYEIIFVNDGSTDASLEVIQRLAKLDRTVKFVDFSRNFGHQVAVTAGYDFASGRAVISLDSDCQHPPEIIPQLVEKWQSGSEVVYTVRTDTEGISGFRRWVGRCVYRVISRASGMDLVDQADFRLLDRKAVHAVRSCREQARFVRGLVRWVGFKQTALPYKAEQRHAGHSTYSVKQLARMGFAGLLNFSLMPLRLVGVVGLVMLSACMLYLLIGGVAALFGWNGFSAIATLLLGVGGLNLLCLFAVAEYVGRIYEETKGRPLYVVRHAGGFEQQEPDAPEPPERQEHPVSNFSVMT